MSKLQPTEPPRSTSNPGLEVLRGGSGEDRGTVCRGIGGLGGQSLGLLGKKAGIREVAETREISNGLRPIAVWRLHEPRNG